MKIATLTVIITILGCIISQAANVGSLHFGVVSSSSDAKGEYKGVAGRVELPKGIAPETIEIELISDGRTMVVWFAAKNQKEVLLKFCLPIADAKNSHLVLKQRLPKDHPDGTSKTIESIDLAKDVFFVATQKSKPNKTQQGKPR